MPITDAALRGVYAFMAYWPIGRPVGRTHPMYQLSRMNRNSATDKPTRSANARAMCLLGEPLLDPSLFFPPLRSMNTPALANAPSTATINTPSTVFIVRWYLPQLQPRS